MPFSIAHGGAQIQIEQTQAALRSIGVDVEPLRWWDATQRPDIIHNFARMPAEQIKLAQQKGIRVVMAELLTGTGSRSARQLWVQKKLTRLAAAILPKHFTTAFNWESYQVADAYVALTGWEAQLMREVFDAPPAKVHVIPNGVEEVFFSAPKESRGDWLVCTATIASRKQVLELAQAAVQAAVPVWIIGRAYDDSDPYAQQFFALARQHPEFIRFEGAISDRKRLAQIYRTARGFVLLSTMESLSLSALEAAACECPMLLSDLPWARTVFGEGASYCPVASAAKMAQALRAFYDTAPTRPGPPKPCTWIQVAEQFKALYERVLSTSS